MADSFFRGTDAELYNGTKNFASIIDTDFATYGISSAQNTNYQSLSASYVAAYEALLIPSTKTKGQTATKNAARILLKVAAGDLARIIEGQSNITDQQKIELGINVRKTPGPVGPPGTPYKFTAQLRPNGSLLMNWKCDNPANSVGVIYQIYRVIDGGCAVVPRRRGKADVHRLDHPDGRIGHHLHDPGHPHDGRRRGGRFHREVRHRCRRRGDGLGRRKCPEVREGGVRICHWSLVTGHCRSGSSSP